MPQSGCSFWARVGVFVEVRTVEHPQAVAVAGEVGRDPVDDHPQVVLVAMVDEVHEVERTAVAARDREVTHRLVAPTARERMLADWHQLQVGIAHFLAVIDELMGQFPIAHPARRVVARPASNCPDALHRSTSAHRGHSCAGANRSSGCRAIGSGSGRPLSRPCAAAIRPRSRRGRISRRPGPDSGRSICRSSLRPGRGQTAPKCPTECV